MRNFIFYCFIRCQRQSFGVISNFSWFRRKQATRQTASSVMRTRKWQQGRWRGTIVYLSSVAIKLDFPFLSFPFRVGRVGKNECQEQFAESQLKAIFYFSSNWLSALARSESWMGDANCDLHQARSLTRMRADSSKSSLGWENIFLLCALFAPFPESLSIPKSSIRQ